MAQQPDFVLRKIWPNISDKIVNCTANLYRGYSLRRFLLTQKPLEPTAKPATAGELITISEEESTLAPGQENAQEAQGSNLLPDGNQENNTPAGGQLEVPGGQGTAAGITIPMPTFILSSASPEPHDVQLRSDSIISLKMSPPTVVRKQDAGSPEHRGSVAAVAPEPASQIRRASSVKQTADQTQLLQQSDLSRRRSSVNANVTQTPIIVENFPVVEQAIAKPTITSTAFDAIAKTLMEIDELTIQEKFEVLRLLMKCRIYERIVTKSLCKAKLFEEIKEEEENVAVNNTDEANPAQPKSANSAEKPPTPARAPAGCPYNDSDFYTFAILALYYYECDYVIRPQSPDEPKIESVQLARAYIKEARIPICAAFAKLHIAAQVRTVAQMLTHDEQKKLAIEESSENSPRDGLVYLFLPDEYSDAQLYLCDQMGAEFLKEQQVSKNAAYAAAMVEEALAANKSNIVSVFSRQESDVPRTQLGTSFLPREQNFRFAFTIPANCISRQVLLERVLCDQQLLLQQQTTMMSDASTGTKVMTSVINEEVDEQQEQQVEKQGTHATNASREGTNLSLTPFQNEVTNLSIAPIGVRISYRCQDRFSAFAMYATVNFLPTAHPGQTAAPVVQMMPSAGGENDVPLVPVSLVVTGLTAPNQLSGLIRLIHVIRLRGPLPLGPLESILIYGLGTMSKAAHDKLTAIAEEPFTSEACKFLELYDEEFMMEALEDERFRSVKVALVYGDISSDLDLTEDSPSYSSIFFDQPNTQNHPLVKTNSGAVMDAVCLAMESSHFIWLCSNPSPVVKPVKTENVDKSTAPGESTLPAPGSDDEENSDGEDLAQTTFSKKKAEPVGKGKAGKAAAEEKRGAPGKSSLAAPPIAAKGGKKGVQMPVERDKDADKNKGGGKDRRKDSVLSVGFAGASNKLLGQKALLDAKLNVTGSRSSLASQGSSPTPAPPKFSATLKPNSAALKLYQTTLHAARLPQIQTIILAVRNAHSSAYGEQFVQSVMQDINEISVVNAAPKITITSETSMLAQQTAGGDHIARGSISTNVPPDAGHHTITTIGPTEQVAGAGAGTDNQQTSTAPILAAPEPPRPTHRISSQLHMVPVPLTASEIASLGTSKDMLSKEETYGKIQGQPSGLTAVAAPTAITSGLYGTGLTVGASMLTPTPSPSITGETGPPVTGIFFDTNMTTPGGIGSNFIFGGFMAAISITRTAVSQKQLGKLKRPPPGQPVRQVSGHH